MLLVTKADQGPVAHRARRDLHAALRSGRARRAGRRRLPVPGGWDRRAGGRLDEHRARLDVTAADALLPPRRARRLRRARQRRAAGARRPARGPACSRRRTRASTSRAGASRPGARAKRLRRSSQPVTASASVARSLVRLWLPGTVTISRSGPAGGMPNGSLAPWTIRTGTSTCSSSLSRDFSRAAGRMERERQAQHALGAGRRRGPARHASPGRAAAGGQRQAVERQLLEHRDPRSVELRGGAASGGPRPGRLLDQRDRCACLVGRLGRSDEVLRGHAAAGAVAEHDREPRVVDGVSAPARGRAGCRAFRSSPRSMPRGGSATGGWVGSAIPARESRRSRAPPNAGM